jgi:hypothetical protein
MVGYDFNSRLEFEKKIMSRNLPQFRFNNTVSEEDFSGWQTTQTRRRRYKLKLSIPSYYPDMMPSLYIISPVTLYHHNGRDTINSQGVSHEFHTQSAGPGGCIQICHYHSSSWNAAKTCVGVFMKGILWLEAYEIHLATADSIASILDNWKRRM